MDNGAKASLALDNDVGNAHLSAKGREVDNQLDWVYVMSDDDQGGLLGLDESNSVVETVLDKEGLLCLLRLRVRHE